MKHVSEDVDGVGSMDGGKEFGVRGVDGEGGGGGSLWRPLMVLSYSTKTIQRTGVDFLDTTKSESVIV